MTTDWKPEAELIEYVRAGQTSEPNWRMRAGTAWHARLEGKAPADGWSFGAEDIQAARHYIGAGHQEMTARDELGGFTIKGTCDWIRGNAIQDHKTKFGACDAKDYEDSLQWRAYLWLFHAESFTYNLFRMDEPDDPEAGGHCELVDITSFRFWRYPDMQADLLYWIDRFRWWADGRGLLDCLASRVAA